jgi:lysophospholipase L1-like esterase
MQKHHAHQIMKLGGLVFSGLLVISGTVMAGSSKCLVMGDSIALGAGAHAPQCMVVAEKGISTHDWVQKFGGHVERSGSFDVVLISLGSNDGGGATVKSLSNARMKVALARRVIWIAPSPKYAARSYVIGVAKTFGDVVYERPIEQLQPDGVHFNGLGYKRIASVVASAF